MTTETYGCVPCGTCGGSQTRGWHKHDKLSDPLGIVTPNPRPTCPVARFGRPHVWCFGFWHEGEFIADEYVKCICGQIEYDG